jgi:hypothetical protein
MADYKKLATDLILADGQIDDAEAKLIRKAVLADGKLDADEIEFVFALRSAAIRKGTAVSEVLEKLYLEAVTAKVVRNGKLSPTAVESLKKHVVGDKKMAPAAKKKFLDKLTKEANVGEKFAPLYAAVEKQAAG